VFQSKTFAFAGFQQGSVNDLICFGSRGSRVRIRRLHGTSPKRIAMSRGMPTRNPLVGRRSGLILEMCCSPISLFGTKFWIRDGLVDKGRVDRRRAVRQGFDNRFPGCPRVLTVAIRCAWPRSVTRFHCAVTGESRVQTSSRINQADDLALWANMGQRAPATMAVMAFMATCIL